MLSPYYNLIQTYLPTSQWANANCISLAECDPASPIYPNCVKDEGGIICGPAQGPAKSYGLFGLLDVCWDPALNPQSPFTADQWAKVLDPNVNTWMASVVWSINGWRAWTTCSQCLDCPPCVYSTPPCLAPCGGNLCAVPGGPIPYPRGPLPGPLPPPVAPSFGLWELLGVGLAVAGLAYLGHKDGGLPNAGR